MRRGATVQAAFAVLTLVASGAVANELGAITGTVRLNGPAPARPSIAVLKNHEVCGNSITDERLVVGPGFGLRYVVVSVEGVRGGQTPERDVTHVLDNRACRFEPHVTAAEVGQWLEIRNSDPILHNADARRGQDTVFNVAMAPGHGIRRPLASEGLVTITCDVHTWMRAYVAVSAHPYHTVTDTYGEYEIRDVPAGTYTLRAWQEELGPREQSVTVEAGKSVTADITYPAPTHPAEAPQ